ncbi:tyrosine-type recombinase/integrase [Budviciaceae bacterium CWB-B4]|uniref:Tyrosine-type recombinase/integrase n=1 Tax=Limnobaculum xujianqingii TaxID=2738837 RepID=A0A9D7FQI4_9GAMM|nr:tyrosine-type recombinase/integrase [Limnobaculum xujianqingii]MBK5071640.1 tyrosine-type recombinase/integrase [Limnobaculum xujianqingii]MBK5174949.1 tyrosine-type recombinase/integrase [Limnobaculum xujianqingii]
MATITKTPAGTWKAIIRKSGWPVTIKTFRIKRDAEDWARRTEDEMMRGAFVQRTPAERMTLETAMKRYLDEVTPTKSPSTQDGEVKRAKTLIRYLGNYSLAALTPEVIARFRDERLAGDINKKGIRKPRKNDTVRLEIALLGHFFTIAIKEWQIGLTYNPVRNIRSPAPAPGRTRRLSDDESSRLLAAVEAHSNPMLRWIVYIALETSMRTGEIINLTEKDVDIEGRVIFLQKTKNHTVRTVPLSIIATKIFQEVLDNPLRRSVDSELLFFGNPGRDKIRRPYQFSAVWGRIKKRLGINNFRFHDLRHEAVSRLVELGLSDQEVSAISGHKSMQMLHRYTHLRNKHLINRLDTLQHKK